MFRHVYQSGGYQQAYNKNAQYPLVGANNYAYVQASSLQQQQMYYNASMGQYGAQRAGLASNSAQKVPRGGPAYQKNNGYQLKVGGVVVGSWANGARNAQAARMNRNGMVKISIEIIASSPLTHFLVQLRYPVTQRTPRTGVTNTRFRAPGSSGFNEKGTQRFVKQQKKQKPKKEAKKSVGDEDETEKKTILKEGEEKPEEKKENG